MPKKILKIFLILAITGALVYLGIRVYVRLNVYNPSASCANCRSFIWHHLRTYAEANDGWFPRGGSNTIDSLSKCVADVGDVHFFTSHALMPQLRAYWSKHGTFSPDLCCYRYVEGLRADDPPGLIILYFEAPTKWECKSHKDKVVGRPVSLTPPAHSWEFLPEEDFQAQLKRTLDFLDKEGRNVGGHNNRMHRIRE